MLRLDIHQTFAAINRAEHRTRELDRQFSAAALDHRPLDDVAEFADITGPGVALQRGHRLAGDCLDLLAECLRKFGDIPPDEQGDVLDTLAERR